MEWISDIVGFRHTIHSLCLWFSHRMWVLFECGKHEICNWVTLFNIPFRGCSWYWLHILFLIPRLAANIYIQKLNEQVLLSALGTLIFYLCLLFNYMWCDYCFNGSRTRSIIELDNEKNKYSILYLLVVNYSWLVSYFLWPLNILGSPYFLLTPTHLVRCTNEKCECANDRTV